MKRILLVSQSQDATFVEILYAALSKIGYSLNVITGKPIEVDPNVTLFLAPKYNSNSILSRLKTWRAYTKAVKRFLKKNIDDYEGIFFTSNPPINQELVQFALKKKKKIMYLIWDIYPDYIEKSFGKLVSPVTSIWRKKNQKLYNQCDAVITIGDTMKSKIQGKNPKLNVRVIPYHANSEVIKPICKKNNKFAVMHGLDDKMVFMYSGKMGFGHGFDEILTAAKDLQSIDAIRFVFIGHGEGFESIRAYILENNLSNCLLLPYQPLDMLPFSLATADVSFITIKEKIDGLFLPSKVYDAMASGSAIVCISAGNNDVALLIEKEKLGANVLVNNVEELKRVIFKFVNDTQYLKECQKNARESAVCHYAMERVVDQYRNLFEDVFRGEI